MLAWAPDVPAPSDPGPPLETLAAPPDRPRLVTAAVIEGDALQARPVAGPPTRGVAAFLDGTQSSRVIGYHDGLPLVFGTVGAVIRQRVERRLVTWSAPLVERRVYLPLSFLPASLAEHYRDRGFAVVDSTEPVTASDDVAADRHPLALADRAVHLVQRHREALEQALAERWCRDETALLYVDGGLNKSDVLARATCAVGVVKSHRTLYVDAAALAVVGRLRAGERSSVFRIPSARRTPVASWYLRVRDPAGHDPLWSLLRVEAADPESLGEPVAALSERADQLSRSILAEASPLALPDARWDKMAYGIRDCEQFLRAVC